MSKEILLMTIKELSEYFKKTDTRTALMTTCIYCGGYAAIQDHVIPKSRGGREGKNLVPCCFDCNSKKGSQTPKEWLGIENESVFFGNENHVKLLERK